MTWVERLHPRDRLGRFRDRLGGYGPLVDALSVREITRVHQRSALDEAKQPATGRQAALIQATRQITDMSHVTHKRDPVRAREIRDQLESALDQARRFQASTEDSVVERGLRRRGLEPNSPEWDVEVGQIREQRARQAVKIRILEQSLRDLDTKPPTTSRYEPTIGWDEIHQLGPLALYGDMLHHDGTAFSAGILETLIEVDPRWHLAVARHLSAHPDGGLYIGAQPVTELDDLGYLQHIPPSGDWAHVPGASFADVNGVYVDHVRVVAIGLTPNALGRGLGRATALHEFGHGLDYALGQDSQNDRWEGIHSGLVRTARGLNPHFNRDNAAGRAETWAETWYLYQLHGADEAEFSHAFHTAFKTSDPSVAMMAWEHFGRVEQRLDTALRGALGPRS